MGNYSGFVNASTGSCSWRDVMLVHPERNAHQWWIASPKERIKDGLPLLENQKKK